MPQKGNEGYNFLLGPIATMARLEAPFSPIGANAK